jgi:hypothetical protein
MQRRWCSRTLRTDREGMQTARAIEVCQTREARMERLKAKARPTRVTEAQERNIAGRDYPLIVQATLEQASPTQG